MNSTSFDPSRRLDLYFRCNRAGNKTFKFFDDAGAALDIRLFEYDVFIYEYEGADTPIVTLSTTEGGGSNNELACTITVSQSNINEGKYYWELYKGSTDKTHLCGEAIFHNGKFDGVTTDTTNLTITDGGDDISITIDDPSSGEYQPLDADLTTIAALSPSNDDILQRKSGVWTNRTLAEVRLDLQPWVWFPIHAIATGAGPITLTNMPNSVQMFPGGANVHGFKFDATYYSFCRVMTRVSVRSLSANDPRFYLQYSVDNGSNWLDAVSPTTTASGNAMSLGTLTNNAASGVAALVSGAKGDWLWRVVHNGGDGVEDPQVCNVYAGFRM
jgi:hypothetical protein